MLSQMFFSNGDNLLRTLVVGGLAYVTLIALLRISGKLTLSKMNAFDFVVTVALGSTLATVLLSKDVALAEDAVRSAALLSLHEAGAAIWKPTAPFASSAPVRRATVPV